VLGFGIGEFGWSVKRRYALFDLIFAWGTCSCQGGVVGGEGDGVG
jgi:hypothetical protein